MPVMTVNGVGLHVTDEGSGPPVVFGHGLLWSGEMFRPQIDALRGGYRCVTVDWRGQGGSEVTPGGYDMDTLTGDLIAVLDQLGLDAVHYVGLSMGGFVGMRLAARHPERVRSLALLNTSAGPEDPEKIGRYRLLARIVRFFGTRPVAGPVEKIMFGPAFLTDPARAAERQRLRRELLGLRRTGTVRATYGVIDRPDVYDLLPAIAAPALVLAGQHDVATPLPKSERLHADIAGSRLVVVPRAGHTSTLEQPEAVTEALSEHLAAAEALTGRGSAEG
ncbi:MAG: alpha/beta fold hydrolase [Micromonosporaceae bacterium]